jgi:orotidine-5'-phosphate decarboxylase
VGRNRIILAADELNLDQGLGLVRSVGHKVYAVKIHNLWDVRGPTVVRQLLDAGAERVWVDLKLHDIPNTIRLRAKAVADAGANILTVHADGEIDMMMAAVNAFPGEIYAITVLTSLDEDQIHLLHGQPSKAAVLYRARLARLAGCAGVVCSPKEVELLAKRPELANLKLIVPGVRSADFHDVADQRRVDTPGTAIKSGATYIVVGRQITQANDPVDALEVLVAEVAGAEEEEIRSKKGKPA